MTSLEKRFAGLLETGDPEEIYDLVDLLATGSYGKVYTVGLVAVLAELRSNSLFVSRCVD